MDRQGWILSRISWAGKSGNLTLPGSGVKGLPGLVQAGGADSTPTVGQWPVKCDYCPYLAAYVTRY